MCEDVATAPKQYGNSVQISTIARNDQFFAFNLELQVQIAQTYKQCYNLILEQLKHRKNRKNFDETVISMIAKVCHHPF